MYRHTFVPYAVHPTGRYCHYSSLHLIFLSEKAAHPLRCGLFWAVLFIYLAQVVSTRHFQLTNSTVYKIKLGKLTRSTWKTKQKKMAENEIIANFLEVALIKTFQIADRDGSELHEIVGNSTGQ